MRELSATLRAALGAESLSPINQVTIEEYRPNFDKLVEFDDARRIYRIKSGSGYSIALMETLSDSTKLYYKRMTSFSSESDWRDGWSSLVTLSGPVSANYQDLYIDGNNVLVVYTDNYGLYARRSTNGGSSWGSTETLATANVWLCAILDMGCVFSVKTDGNIYRHQFMGGTWVEDNIWQWGNYWGILERSELMPLRAFLCRKQGEGHYLLWNGYMGNTAEWKTAAMVCLLYYKHGFRRVTPLWGQTPISFDYFFYLRGLSDNINGYYFGLFQEQYNSFADATVYPNRSYEYLLARTSDFQAFHMIPMNYWHSVATTYSYYAQNVMLPGIVKDENYIYVPITGARTGWGTTVLRCAKSSWWGETATKTELPILEPLTINNEQNAASSCQITVDKDQAAAIKYNSALRVYSGYKTAAGDEMPQCFLGLARNRSIQEGATEDISIDLFDPLIDATSIEQATPKILTGQNALHIHSSIDPNMADYFVPQSGAWQKSGDAYQMYRTGVNAVSLCGYEPSNSHWIRCQFVVPNNIGNVRVGLVAYQPRVETKQKKAYLAYYDGAAKRFHIGVIDTETLEGPTVYESSDVYELSNNTNYHLLAKFQYNVITLLFSTNGITFTEVVTYPISSTAVGPGGHVGLYAFITQDVNTVVNFYRIVVVSADQYLDGSKCMRFLAELSGNEVQTDYDLYDDFDDGIIGPRWVAQTGTWNESGSQLYASVSASVSYILTDISDDDIILEALVTRTAGGIGFIARYVGGEGIVALVYGTKVGIYSVNGTTLTTLYEESKTIATTDSPHKIALVMRGKVACFYLHNQLVAMATLTSEKVGQVGLAAFSVGSSVSYVESFSVGIWHRPVDVMTVRPGDNVGSIMQQLATMHGGYMYCNRDGKIRYAVSGSGEPLIIDSLILDKTSNFMVDQIKTQVRVTGNMAYAEARDQSWAHLLSAHRYTSVQLGSRNYRDCLNAGNKVLEEGKRVEEFSISFMGHPGLEVGDLIQVDDKVCQVRNFSETIGLGEYTASCTVALTAMRDMESARVRATTTQSLTQNAWTVADLHVERWDTGEMSVLSARNRLTAPRDGLYLISFGAAENNFVSGEHFRVGLRLNGSTLIAVQMLGTPESNWVPYLSVSTLYPLAAGDYVEGVIYTNQAGRTTVIAAGASVELSMRRIGR